MPGVHRNFDARFSGAPHLVVGNPSVRVENRLAAVFGDPDRAGGGQLLGTIAKNVRIHDKLVQVLGDKALGDAILKNNPAVQQVSQMVKAGGAVFGLSKYIPLLGNQSGS